MNYATPPKKMLILNILDILKKYSDENHRLSAKKIGELLENEYAQKVDRKAIKRNLMNLLDFGYDIEFTETVRKKKNGEEEILYSDWYLNREFTDAELRLLIDSLLFSKTIPANQCRQMISKLKGLSSNYFDVKVRHIHSLPENPPENKQVFWTIDVLDEAITKGYQVSFQYLSYGTDKKAHPRKAKDDKNNKIYTVSPYQMAATNGRYYLICNRTGYSQVSNYRVDRIVNIKLTEQPITPLKKLKGYEHGLNLPKHMAEHIYMFAGDSVKVMFLAKSYLIGELMDWFGRDVEITEVDGETVQVDVKVNENAMFYWLMQYGEHVEVKKPQRLRERVGQAALAMANKYAEC